MTFVPFSPARVIIPSVSTPEKNDFHLDTTFTDSKSKLVVPIAIAVAALGIIGIFATMTTDVAGHLLPMSDEYLQVLVPQASDGKEPLALKTLENSTMDKTLTVTGTVENRTEFPVSGIVAVLDAIDVGYAKQKIEVPLDPPEIPSKGAASFTASVTFPGQPAQFSLTFRIADGPVVAHHDDRSATYGFGDSPPAGAPTIKTK